ncbi:aldehyde-activating protein [Pseudoalteromonas citrea]|uniref:Aldehyde-activating protein n=1 Tax=Pseudoalteromonas citrea TaxID=43655 RepID=A0A5S3XNX2_9GAMM|nr:GFA family protein [Pseudoalteromonas citrea]TMP42433.1 aldehyde-activating protein [Pseudoalteromonas citrea]TMP58747.1 aldehyde-activating protein [Pseudoalteromonas citrea]
MYKASCLCGAVKVEIHGPITDIIHCHCSLCRKSTGTAYATNGFVETDLFKVVAGREDITHFEFKPGRKRHFCRHCASPIYSSNSDTPQKIRFRLGILDTPIAERPMSHNFVTSKADWEDLDAQLPRYERFEPGRG